MNQFFFDRTQIAGAEGGRRMGGRGRRSYLQIPMHDPNGMNVLDSTQKLIQEKLHMLR